MSRLGEVRGRFWLRLSVALLCCLGASVAVGQLSTATILGVVKDSSGAVIPGAKVTARDVETGQTRTESTAGDGSFRIPALPVGTYEVTVAQTGFETAVRSGVTLSVSQEAVLNFSLSVGTVGQTVQVTAEAPLVNTTSGSLGGLVSEERVADLPLNGRNYIDLTLLQPGVTQHTQSNVPSGAFNGTLYSSNGAPVRSNTYLLDGANMNSWYGGTAASVGSNTLGIDGIREYRVVTNSFTAEYGMTMGSQMQIVSKGGTNRWHGSAFEYVRNSDLDARNFYDYPSAATSSTFRLPPFRRNQFGGSFGGPIKKDRTFFFGTYEELRVRLGVTTITNTLAPGCHGAAGAVITNAQCPQLGTVSSVTVQPIVAPLLALFPLPNLSTTTPELTFPYSQPTNEEYGQMRVDHTFSSKDAIFGRYTIDNGLLYQAQPFLPYVNDGWSRSQFITASENHIFTPTLLNTLSYSVSRMTLLTATPSPARDFGPQYVMVPGQPMGDISVTGLSTLGPAGTLPNYQRQTFFTTSEDLFYTHGKHALKFGMLWNHIRNASTSGNGIRGTVSFASVATFLQGLPSTIADVTPGSDLARDFHEDTWGFYAQDSYRMTSTFTLNVGLRWEFMTTPRIVSGINANLRSIAHDDAGTLGPIIQEPSLHNWSPRVGFAWDIFGDGKTSLRGGFGLLYDISDIGAALQNSITGTPPISSRGSAANPGLLTLPLSFPANTATNSLFMIDYHLTQPHLMQWNLTIERQLPSSMVLSVAYAASRGFDLMQFGEGNPTIPSGTPTIVNGQLQCLNLSPAPAFSLTGPFCWTGKDPRTNPFWGTDSLDHSGGDSWYNSLQVSLLKRLTHGLQVQASYTWSKVMDDTQGQSGGEDSSSTADTVDPARPMIDYAPAAFDVTQNLRVNGIYTVPAFVPEGGIAGKVLDNWRASPILTIHSGYPFSPDLGSNQSLSQVGGGGGGIDRPNLLPGYNGANMISGTTGAGCPGVPGGEPVGTPNLYFNPCAFSLPTAGFLGTAGRDILRGPGYIDLDFSLDKDWPLARLGEGGKLEFRAEVFNIFNRANLNIPSGRAVFTGTSGQVVSTAGQITSTGVNTARQIQFALRLEF